MKKKLLLSLSLLILSCGGYDSVGISDDNTAEARRYEILKALDEGRYDYVIQKLENDPSYGGAFTLEEGKLNLAAAYVGKAGYDYADIINDILEAKQDDPSKSLVQAFVKRSRGKNLAILEKAKKLYSEIIGTNDCAVAQDYFVKEACFYYGLVNSVQATTSLTLTVGGIVGTEDSQELQQTVEDWIDAVENNKTLGCDKDVNDNDIPDQTDISACAIEYGQNGNCTVDNASVDVINPSLTFGGNYTFEYVKITINPDNTVCSGYGSVEKYVLIDSQGYPAITDGYCDTDFNSCTEGSPGCYPCPVVADGQALGLDDTLQNAINEIDTVFESVGADTEVVNKLKEFRRDVCENNPGACTCTLDDCEIQDINAVVDYLLNK